ncbi:MAG: SUMF1/EgtB/PvdO family nonheme iron enzyme, partial [Magnetococcales bacterium]|nr:SUMF1/EgtB/PvdO family nonheme iron enzyme [Magnetococcales bacterium]
MIKFHMISWVVGVLTLITPVFCVWSGDGVVDLNTIPPGAHVYVDGKLEAKSTPAKIQLASGLRRFELKKKGYDTLDFSLFLTDGVTLSKSMLLIPMGSIESSGGSPIVNFLDETLPQRDSFETDEEYDARQSVFKWRRLEKLHQFNRMAGNPTFSAGTAVFVKDKYNIHSGRFSIKFTPRKWANSLLKLENSYIYASRDQARELFSFGSIYPVYIAFSDEGKIDRAFIRLKGRSFSLMRFGRFNDPMPDMKFVAIQGSCFSMGSNHGDIDEKPEHGICLDSYWIGRHEVTQGQWMKVMGDNPSRYRRGKDHPVERVSWKNVQQFIEKLNSKSGLKFRLPTEAQWE